MIYTNTGILLGYVFIAIDKSEHSSAFSNNGSLYEKICKSNSSEFVIRYIVHWIRLLFCLMN